MLQNRRWTSHAAVLLACLVFAGLGLLMIQYPGAQYDEVLFVSSLHAPAEIEYVAQTPFGGVPVMLMTYIGTFKAALYAPFLWLAGSGHLTLRLPVLAFGTVSIALLFLALRRLTDTRVAILVSLLLATDSIYLLTCVFDWGPVALQHLLVTALLYTSVRFVQEQKSRWLFAAALCAGLALWDKALFIWLLAGFSAAAAIVYPRELWGLIRKPRLAAVCAVGFAFGSGPLLFYNVTHHWRTFAANAQAEPNAIDGKLRMLRRTFDGSGLMGYLVLEDPAGPPPALKVWEKGSVALNDGLGDPRWSLQYYVLLGALVLAPVLCWRGSGRRISLLLLLGGVFATAVMLSTAGTGGSIHHTVLLWPLPQLLLGLALFAFFSRWPGGTSKAAAAVVLLCVVSNLLVVNMYLAHFIQNGPALLWTDAVRGLVQDLGRRPGRVVFAADWGMLQQVEYYGEGRIGYHSGSDGIVPGLREPGNAVQMKRFLAAFPTVRTISPWNEINHFSQGTSRDPRAAARFTDKVRQLCPGCTIVAADVLDQADDPSAAHPTFRQTSSYIKRFRHFLKTPRTICGIHNYSDVNRFRSTGTKAVMKALGCKQYWFTETGGLYRFGSFWSKKTKKGCSTNASCQLKATKYMFSLANANRKVTRLYIYTWFGGITPRFDAGLVAAGKPRPAYREVEKRLG